MRAIVYDAYGPPDVLRVGEIPKPSPGSKQVLIKVIASGLTPYDWRYMRAKPFAVRLSSGLFRPKRKTLGLDFAGIVEAVGEGVTTFKSGDQVFGLAPMAFAEYIVARESQIVTKPPEVSFIEASVVSASAITALQCLRDHGGLAAGEAVLINGASGGVGTFAVQIAKYLGATVTGVCSGRNVELVRSIGADFVLDYQTVDIAKKESHYDLIVDAVGNHSIAAFMKMLRPSGRLVAAAGPLLRLLWLAAPGRSRTVSMIGNPNADDMNFIRDLLASGAIVPVVDRSYDFEDVRSAITYLETGRARGKVVLIIADQ